MGLWIWSTRSVCKSQGLLSPTALWQQRSELGVAWDGVVSELLGYIDFVDLVSIYVNRSKQDQLTWRFARLCAPRICWGHRDNLFSILKVSSSLCNSPDRTVKTKQVDWVREPCCFHGEAKRKRVNENADIITPCFKCFETLKNTLSELSRGSKWHSDYISKH